MSLAKRLNAMERRIAELEEWKREVELALEAEDARADVEHQTLDGDVFDAGERDQTQSLG
jgi:hypothetical protein